MAQGPGPGATTPSGTGRASGAGVPKPFDPNAPRIVVIAGERYQVPPNVTNEQVAEAMGVGIDTLDAPQHSFGEAAPEIQSRIDTGRTASEVISAIPGAALGGIQMAGALREPALQLGSKLLGRAVPGLSRVQAVSAVQRGGAPLLASSIKKLTPATAKIMKEALPSRMGSSVMNMGNVGIGAGIGSFFGLPHAGALAGAATLAGRPLPLSLIAQGIGSSGAVAGPVAGAAGGGLAQLALNRLLGGGQ